MQIEVAPIISSFTTSRELGKNGVIGEMIDYQFSELFCVDWLLFTGPCSSPSGLTLV